MKYLSEILVCKDIKKPVKLYISTIATEEYATMAENFCKRVTKALQENHRAYLSKYIGFLEKEIVYAEEKPDKGTENHERWHNHLEEKGIVSVEGEFIEEASAYVIDDVTTGNYHTHLGLSKNSFIPTYLLIQKTKGEELKKILGQFGKNIPEWEERVMKGSCDWLYFLDEAKYFLLYDLCFDICANKGVTGSKRIYKESLRIAKRKGIKEGINHLRENASKEISDLYDFKFDIGGYLPDYPQLAKYAFFGGKVVIEADGAHKSWLNPLEEEIKVTFLKKK